MQKTPARLLCGNATQTLIAARKEPGTQPQKGPGVPSEQTTASHLENRWFSKDKEDRSARKMLRQTDTAPRHTTKGSNTEGGLACVRPVLRGRCPAWPCARMSVLCPACPRVRRCPDVARSLAVPCPACPCVSLRAMALRGTCPAWPVPHPRVLRWPVPAALSRVRGLILRGPCPALAWALRGPVPCVACVLRGRVLRGLALRVPACLRGPVLSAVSCVACPRVAVSCVSVSMRGLCPAWPCPWWACPAWAVSRRGPVPACRCSCVGPSRACLSLRGRSCVALSLRGLSCVALACVDLRVPCVSLRGPVPCVALSLRGPVPAWPWPCVALSCGPCVPVPAWPVPAWPAWHCPFVACPAWPMSLRGPAGWRDPCVALSLRALRGPCQAGPCPCVALSLRDLYHAWALSLRWPCVALS
ncbi:unnamed protein product [Boreogadus saida]